MLCRQEKAQPEMTGKAKGERSLYCLRKLQREACQAKTSLPIETSRVIIQPAYERALCAVITYARCHGYGLWKVAYTQLSTELGVWEITWPRRFPRPA